MDDHAAAGTRNGERRDGERRLRFVLALTAGFMLIEVAGGLWSGSLALLADAAHMGSDAAALALALASYHYARRAADARRPYGYGRLPVLAAWTSATALLMLALWIVIEAAQRLFTPAPVLAGIMLAVAVAGFFVNLTAFALLRGGDRRDLNLRAVLAHVAGDLAGSAAAIAAALVILATGWTPVDPLLSLFVAALITRAALGVLREAGHVLLQGVPEGFDAAAVTRDLLAAVPALTEVHALAAWSLGHDLRVATLHVRLAEGADPDAALAALRTRLAQSHGFVHVTVQFEHGPCPGA